MRETLVRSLCGALLLACALFRAEERTLAAPPEEPAEPLPAGAVLRIGTVRFQHAHANRLEFSPDGKRLLTVAFDGIRLWDTATGKPLREIQLDYTNFAGFTQDGKTIVAWNTNPKGKGSFRLGENPVVHVLDADTGKELRQFPLAGSKRLPMLDPQIVPCKGLGMLATAIAGEPILVYDVKTGKEARRLDSENAKGLRPFDDGLRFSPDGKLLAGSTYGDVYYVFDTATGKEVQQFPVEKRNKDRSSSRDGCPLLFSLNGKVLCSGRHEGSFYFWDLDTGKEIGRIKDLKEESYVRAAFAPDGKKFCAWDTDAGVRIWELPSGKLLHQVKLRCFEGLFSPDGKHFAVTEWDAIHLIDVATGKVLHKVPWGTSAFAFSPDGSSLATIERDTGRIWFWQLPAFERDEHFGGEHRAVEFLALATDGKSLASWNGLGHWRWNELVSGKALGRFSVPGGGQFALSVDGKLLASRKITYAVDEPLVLREADSGKEKRRLTSPEDLLRDFAFSPDARFLAIGSWRHDGKQFEIALSETEEGRQVRKFDPLPLEAGEGTFKNSWSFRGLVFSPDARTLAASGYRWAFQGESHSGVYLWDVGRGKKHPLVWGKQEAEHFVYTPDGRCLLLVNRGQPTRLLEVASGEERVRFEETAEAIQPFVFSDDGKFLASARKSQTLGNSPILIWDAYTGKKWKTLPGHADRVLSLTFTPDGKRLISGSADSTILVWDVGELARAPANPLFQGTLFGGKQSSAPKVDGTT